MVQLQDLLAGIHSASNYCLGQLHDTFPFHEMGQEMDTMENQDKWYRGEWTTQNC